MTTSLTKAAITRQREDDFAKAYAAKGEITHHNLGRSYIAAGYAPAGASSHGKILLQKARVRALVDRLEAQQKAAAIADSASASSGTDWTVDKTEAELVRIMRQAESDRNTKLRLDCAMGIARLRGHLREAGDAPPEQRQAMSREEQRWSDALTVLIVSGLRAIPGHVITHDVLARVDATATADTAGKPHESPRQTTPPASTSTDDAQAAAAPTSSTDSSSTVAASAIDWHETSASASASASASEHEHQEPIAW